MYCKNCGKEIDGDSKFCPECGAVIKSKAEEAVKAEETVKLEEAEAVQAEETAGAELSKREETAKPKETVPKTKKRAEKPKVEKTKSGKKKKWLIPVIIAACAAVAAILLVPKLLSGTATTASLSSGNENHITYIKDEQINVLDVASLDKFEATSQLNEFISNYMTTDDGLSAAMSVLTFTSDDGRYLYYPDRLSSDMEALTYYYRDLNADNTKTDAAVKIDSDIQLGSLRTSADGKKAFYIKDGNLYAFTTADNNKAKISNGVSGVYYIDDAGGRVVFLKSDSALGTGDIYEYDFKNEKNKIVSEATLLAVSADTKTVYYERDGNLYKYVTGEDSEKLSADVASVEYVGQDGSLYITKEKEEKQKLLGVFTDDMKDADESLKAPDENDYGEDKQDEYKKAAEEYNAKLLRDKLRAELEDATYSYTNTQLYYLDSQGAETLVSDDFIETYIMNDNGVYIYVSLDQDEPSSVKMSKLKNYACESIYSSWLSKLNDSPNLNIALGGSVTELDYSSLTLCSVSPNGDKVFYLNDYKNSKGTLTRIDIMDGVVGAPVEMKELVYSYGVSGDGSCVYFINVKDGHGDLFRDDEYIDTDVYTASVGRFADTNKLVYLSDYNAEYGGTLKINDGNGAKTIDQDVYEDFYVSGADTMFYFTDYNTGKLRGTLMRYNGASEKADDDVSLLLKNIELPNTYDNFGMLSKNYATDSYNSLSMLTGKNDRNYNIFTPMSENTDSAEQDFTTGNFEAVKYTKAPEPELIGVSGDKSNYLSAGYTHTVGLKADGTVVAVGSNNDGQCDVSDWTNIVAVSARYNHTVGLKSDGTVVAEGYNDDDEGKYEVSEWTDIVAISTSGFHTVGLKSDGTVVAVGRNTDGECDVSGWKDIAAVSAGYRFTIGLKTDGTVVAVGYNEDGRCNVSDWKDIVAVSAGNNHTVGLKSDGAVVAVGNNDRHDYGQCDVSGWTDIVAISANACHTVGLKADGTVVACGLNDIGQCDVSEWTGIVAVTTGFQHTVGLKSDGTVVAVGENESGQCDVSDWSGIGASSAAKPAAQEEPAVEATQTVSQFDGAWIQASLDYERPAYIIKGNKSYYYLIVTDEGYSGVTGQNSSPEEIKQNGNGSCEIVTDNGNLPIVVSGANLIINGVEFERITDSELLNEMNMTNESSSGNSTLSAASGVFDSNGFLFPDSDSRYLTWDDLTALYNKNMAAGTPYYMDDLLGFARNEIFARHGETFTKSPYKEHYSQYLWYTNQYIHDIEDYEFQSTFNAYEKANIEFILEVESAEVEWAESYGV